MKKFALPLLQIFGFAAAMWFGFVEGIQGARNVVTFWVWVVLLPLNVLAFAAMLLMESVIWPTRTSTQAAVVAAGRLVYWASIAPLSWHGHFATAGALGIAMTLGEIIHASEKAAAKA